MLSLWKSTIFNREHLDSIVVDVSSAQTPTYVDVIEQRGKRVDSTVLILLMTSSIEVCKFPSCFLI
jgi:hypothetical protein